MTALYMFLAAVLVLTPLVALHEWGHYMVARLCGVKVLTYSIGFGTRLFGWTSKKTGIDYRICAIPLGGYVRMLDEREGQVPEHEKHLAFNTQHPLKKIAIVAAGPIMNFVIAIVLFFILFLQPSEQLNTKIGRLLPNSPVAHSTLQVGDKITAVDGYAVDTWEAINYRLVERMGESGSIVLDTQNQTGTHQHVIAIWQFMQGNQKGLDPLRALGVLPWQPVIEPIVGTLHPDGAGALMGLQVGDKITAIDGVPIDNWLVVTELIQASPEKRLNFSIVRQNQPMQLSIMPRPVKVNGRVIGQIGVQVKTHDVVKAPVDYRMMVTYTPQEALSKAINKTYELSKMTLSSMGKMLTGLIGLDNLSGPISIAQVSKDSFVMGWMQVLSTAALISISLAVLNLLPIPVLDGGHLVFYTYELLVGKPMPQAIQTTGFQIGFTLLICCMVLAIGNDIVRMFG